MTFVSKGMAQKSGKSHICNVKCRKFCDGEQDFPSVFEGTLVCQQVYRDRCSKSSFLLWKRWLLYEKGWLKNPENRTFAMWNVGSSPMERNTSWCLWRYSGMPTGASWQMFELIYSFVKKMTFVSKGMAQKSGKSHICNVNCRKFRDGEQDVLVSLKVLWYASKCIVTDFRIHLFFCEKMTLVSKGMAQKSWKSYICNVICRKFCDGEQHVLVFVKVLWYANKCIVIDVRIHLFFCEKNDFCIKRDGSKIMKNASLQCKM